MKFDIERLSTVLVSFSWLCLFLTFFGGLTYASGRPGIGLCVGFVLWFIVEFKIPPSREAQ